LLPENRRLIYPFVGFEFIEDRYQTTSNRDQIDRTEDFYLGTRLSAKLGYAHDDLGSDRNAVIYGLTASRGYGSISNSALFLATALTGRFEDRSIRNSVWHADSRYYRQQSSKRLFFMTLSSSWGRRLDLDNLLQLGGDNGLRGYPLRYQVGDRRVLLTVEQRYFTDWYPFRLVRVGGAVFADAGRTWGDNPAGGPPLGWLKDLGIGLRLAPTRASGRDIIHLDLAFPLDGDPSIDSVQVLLQSKRSF
jgi:hemolysin activation/secretion protein